MKQTLHRERYEPGLSQNQRASHWTSSLWSFYCCKPTPSPQKSLRNMASGNCTLTGILRVITWTSTSHKWQEMEKTKFASQLCCRELTMLCTGKKSHETLVNWHLQTHCSASRDSKQMGDSIEPYQHWSSISNTLPSSLPTSTWIAFYNSSPLNITWIWCFNALWTISIGWNCSPCRHSNKPCNSFAPSTPALYYTTCQPLCHGNAIQLHDARFSKMARAYINISIWQTFRNLQISTEGCQLKQEVVSNNNQFFKIHSVTTWIWWLPHHSHDSSNNSTRSDSLSHFWTVENSMEFISWERYWQPLHRPFKGYSFSWDRP